MRKEVSVEVCCAHLRSVVAFWLPKSLLGRPRGSVRTLNLAVLQVLFCMRGPTRAYLIWLVFLEAPLRTSIATTIGLDGPTLGRYISASLLVKGIM